MKRLIIHLLIAVFTFTISIASIWLINNTLMLVRISIDEPILSADSSPEEFTPTFRACGMGYVQGYTTPSGESLFEGNSWHESSSAAKRAWQEELKKATKIIERTPKPQNKFGVEGESVIAFFSNTDGTMYVQLMSYDGGEYYKSINAPSLEIALRFEKFLTNKH